MRREEWGEMKGSVRLGETSERREERKAHREDGKRSLHTEREENIQKKGKQKPNKHKQR